MKVLFVCTGNTCRSPMAMFLFNDMAKEGNHPALSADSAGISAGCDPINEKAVCALEKRGIKCDKYISKRINPELYDSADIIVVMSQQHKQLLEYVMGSKKKIYVLGNGIGDPYGMDQSEYDNCLNKIEEGIKQLAKEGVFGD